MINWTWTEESVDFMKEGKPEEPRINMRKARSELVSKRLYSLITASPGIEPVTSAVRGSALAAHTFWDSPKLSSVARRMRNVLPGIRLKSMFSDIGKLHDQPVKWSCVVLFDCIRGKAIWKSNSWPNILLIILHLQTFIHQPSHEVITSNLRIEMDALEAIGYQIDQELHDLATIKINSDTTSGPPRRTSSAPDLLDVNMNATFVDLDASSLCTVDDLSNDTPQSARRNSNFQHSISLQDSSCSSSDWLDTRL